MNKKVYLYIIDIYYDGKYYIKIGVTKQLNKRLHELSYHYDIKLEHSIVINTLNNKCTRSLEKLLLSLFPQLEINIDTPGHTELRNCDAKDEVLNFLNKINIECNIQYNKMSRFVSKIVPKTSISITKGKKNFLII